MKGRHVVPIFSLCIALILPSCTSSPTLTSPTQKCIDGTWAYNENLLTNINISPDLKIEIDWDNSYFPMCHPSIVVGKTITIFGDGRVVYSVSHCLGDDPRTSVDTKTIIEKHIQKGQLQRVVDELEKSNIFAISMGCGEIPGIALDAPRLSLLVETDGKVYSINDNTACVSHPFKQFCDLGDKIEVILELD